jgi:4a-hydroxytetrahydrobiopterin dehydratase
MSVKNEPALSEAEVTAHLAKALPAWRLEDGWVRRTYKTNSWKGTLMVVNTVGHLSEAAWHHPDMTMSYAWVEVRLMTHSAKGITRKDLELAAEIERVLMWQPAADPNSALDGTPQTDLRFSYIKYE